MCGWSSPFPKPRQRDVKMITVSIIDDDPEVRDNIAKYVNTARDMRCISAYQSAAEALKGVPQDHPGVVLMDINMAGMNGIECTRKLKLALPGVNILMLTVFDDSDQIFKPGLRANGYLLKRSSPEKLLEAIRTFPKGIADVGPDRAESRASSGGAAPRRRASELSHPSWKFCKGWPRSGLQTNRRQLNVSIHTVRNYIRRVYEKIARSLQR